MLWKLIRPLIAAAVWIGIGGCAIPSVPSDTIKPPMPADVSGLHQQLLGMLPERVRLLTPAGVGHQDEVSLGDMDKDGIDEAVIVYETTEADRLALKAALFKKDGGRWRIAWNGQGFGNGLDYSGFRDLNGDGAPELILGWSLGAGEKGLSIYEWTEGELQLVGNKGYRGLLSWDNIER